MTAASTARGFDQTGTYATSCWGHGTFRGLPCCSSAATLASGRLAPRCPKRDQLREECRNADRAIAKPRPGIDAFPPFRLCSAKLRSLCGLTGGDHAAVKALPQRYSLRSLQIRCLMTASLRATAALAGRIPIAWREPVPMSSASRQASAAGAASSRPRTNRRVAGHRRILRCARWCRLHTTGSAGCETETGANRSRSSEPRGVIDDGGVRGGDHDADAGDCRQPPRSGIGTCHSEDLPIEHLYLPADGMPHNEQRFDDRYQHVVAGDLLADAKGKTTAAAAYDDQAECLEQRPDRVGDRLALQPAPAPPAASAACGRP